MRKKILLCFICILLLAGCGKKDSDAIEKDYNQIDALESGQALLKDALGVDEDVWTKSIELNGKTININAKVSVPETDHMGVVAVERVEMDSEYKREVLKELCDGGEVFVLDKENPPKWYMESRLNFFNEKMETIGEIWFEAEDRELYNRYKELSAGQAENPDKVSEQYTENVYYGKVNGKYTIFEFDLYGDNELIWKPLDRNHTVEWLNKEADGTFELSYSLLGGEDGNESEMTMEEAVRYCDNILEKMQLYNYEMLSSKSMLWQMQGSELFEMWTEGYEITYSAVIEGVKVDALEKENILFRITDAGIMEAYIMGPYTVKDTLEQRAELLSYEKIKGVFSDVLKQNPEYFSFSDPIQQIDKMELFYYLQEEKGENVRLPVWMLSDSESDYRVMVNAIDGTVIGKDKEEIVRSDTEDEGSSMPLEPGKIHEPVDFSEAPQHSKDSLAVSLGVNESKWEEDISIAVKDRDIDKVHIDADVIVPDTDSMPVVTMQARIYTSEEKKNIVEALFDKNSVFVLEDEQLHNKNAIPLEPSGTYEENGYIGTVNGRKERLIFYMERMILSVEEEEQMTKRAVGSSANVSNEPGDTDYGNLCSMTKEEAIESAKNHLAQLGYADYDVCKTQYLNWMETDEYGNQTDIWTDGYFFTLARRVNGVTLDIENYEIGLSNPYSAKDRYGIEWMFLKVNDQGLLFLNDINAYKNHKLEKNEKLLSYKEAKEKIIALAKKEDADYHTYLINSSFKFEEMKLIYFRSCAKDGGFRLIPVWRLSSKYGGLLGNGSITACIMINAIDGTEINLESEFYELPE